MRYWYDTEFHEDGHTVDLISIGIVAEDGREYYAVNHDADWDRVKKNEWLCENVVPHLPLTPRGVWRRTTSTGHSFNIDTAHVAVKPKWVIRNEVREFLTATPDTELWACYGAYDHVALAQLFGPMVSLPDGVPMYTHDIMQLGHHLGVTEKPAVTNSELHNALADARWTRDVHKWLAGGTPMTPEEAQTYIDSPISKGPWEHLHERWADPDGTPCERFSVIAGGDAILETIDFDPAYHDPRANTALAAVAPDMAATIAAHTWEYALDYREPGSEVWESSLGGWKQSMEAVRDERESWLKNIPDNRVRVVRRPVGPIEVVAE